MSGGIVLEQRFPKPKVGGSTPLGTAMKTNENFQFVARANLILFAKSDSGATRGYMGRCSFTGRTAGAPKARTRNGEGIVQTTNEPNARTRPGKAANAEVV
jgi:hypothetical protein